MSGEYYVDEMSCRRYVMSGRWVVAEIGCRGYGLSGYGFGEMLRWGKGKGFSQRNLDGISDISLLANLASRINVSHRYFFPNFNSFWCYTIQRIKRNAFPLFFDVHSPRVTNWILCYCMECTDIYILAQVLSHYYSDYAIVTTQIQSQRPYRLNSRNEIFA